MRHRLPMFERVSQRLAGEALDSPASYRRGDEHGFRVFEYGDIAFQEILDRIEKAERRVEMRAFLWRDDQAGVQLGEAVLNAADRGVEITIHKDRVAAVYEYSAGSKQSFFHKRKHPAQGLQAWFLSTLFRTGKVSKQTPNPLAEAILEHPNITVDHQRKRFDHSKLFIFDDRYITLGSMGIGDNHLHDWLDVMVELDGRQHVQRLRERLNGEVEFDPDRDVDFLVHSRQTAKKRHCPMLDQRLALIEAARRSLTIEMAYLGDPRFTTALLRAVRRGVEVTLVTAAQADVLGHLNRATCDTLLRRTGAPNNLRIILIPRMVHAKIVVVDRTISDIGSANFTPLSHGVYDEINLYAVNAGLAEDLERVIEQHAGEGVEAERRLVYRRFNYSVERAVVAYQSRKGGLLNKSAMPKQKLIELKRAEREARRRDRMAKKVERKEQREMVRQERVEAKQELRAERRRQRLDKKLARQPDSGADGKQEEPNARQDAHVEREAKRPKRGKFARIRRSDKQEQRQTERERARSERGKRKRTRKFPRVLGRHGTNEPLDRP